MNTTKAIVGAGAVLVLAAGAAGCSSRAAANGDISLSGSKYCTPFKTTATSANAAGLTPTQGDPAAQFDDCIHRWAYTLAPARDPADVVARAAVDACGPLLTAWNQQTLGQMPEQQPARGFRGGGGQQQNNPLAQRMGMVESRALFYVVQARAAGCSPPPANTLATSNLTG